MATIMTFKDPLRRRTRRSRFPGPRRACRLSGCRRSGHSSRRSQRSGLRAARFVSTGRSTCGWVAA